MLLAFPFIRAPGLLLPTIDYGADIKPDRSSWHQGCTSQTHRFKVLHREYRSQVRQSSACFGTGVIPASGNSVVTFQRHAVAKRTVVLFVHRAVFRRVANRAAPGQAIEKYY